VCANSCLIAEDSTAWGRDLGLELPDLVEALADLEGEHRVRVMYAYPNRFPWRLTELLRDHPRVVPYLDIPIQHIATPVLRAMRRNGSGDQVRRTLDRLREEVPGITLRTTVLLGFPGEREEDVDELVEYVRSAELGRLGAFIYSPEEGTQRLRPGGRRRPRGGRGPPPTGAGGPGRGPGRLPAGAGGEDVELLVDEWHPAGRGLSTGYAVARTERDAPEVDLIATLEGEQVPVGARVRARVHELDAEANLVCGPSSGSR
jgi:ribosomal protein S12 methylthiotransferase